jgi:hypothetical protein
MTPRNVLLVAIAVLFAMLSLVAGYQYAHLQRVVHDQREYIELGCVGRYQGEE